MATDPLERLHLRFLKWTLGVHKKCSNLVCYGNTGRYPLAIKISKQVMSYYNRLQNLASSSTNLLVCHAYKEQRASNLAWLTNMRSLTGVNDVPAIDGALVNPITVRTNLEALFNRIWNTQIHSSSKLLYYNLVNKETEI